MKKTLKKLAESFNYLSGVKDLSIMREDLDEEVKVTPDQEKELMDIMLTYIKDPADAEEKIEDYLNGTVSNDYIPFDIRTLGNIDGDFENKIIAWGKKHNFIKEGTCGYSVDVKPADTPAGPDLIKLKIRELIKKEIQNLKK